MVVRREIYDYTSVLVDPTTSWKIRKRLVIPSAPRYGNETNDTYSCWLGLAWLGLAWLGLAWAGLDIGWVRMWVLGFVLYGVIAPYN